MARIMRTIPILFILLGLITITPPQVTAQDTTSSAEVVKQGIPSEPANQVAQSGNKQGVVSGVGAPFEYLLGTLDDESDQSETRARQLFAHIPEVVPDLYTAFLKLCPIGISHFGNAARNGFSILLFILFGLVIEYLCKKWIVRKHFSIPVTQVENLHNFQRFFAALINEIPDVIGLCLFFGASYLSFTWLESTQSALAQTTFFAVLISISMMRVVAIISKTFLSPTVSSFRFLPVGDEAATRAHRLLTVTFGYIIVAMMFSVLLKKFDTQIETVQLISLFFATLLLAATGLWVLIHRERVRIHIIGEVDESQDTGWGRREFAAIWHLLAIIYLGLLWFLLVSSITSPQKAASGAFLLSFFVVPLWMIADQIVQWLVRLSMTTLKLHQEEYEDEGEVDEIVLAARTRGKELYQKTLAFSRTALVAALCIWVADLWNFKIPFLSGLTSVLFQAFVILTLALLFWQFVSGWIERKIEESMPEEEESEESDDEWGGAANRGRSYTLLPMVRKFIASILMVMVTLTLLSSLGVDIGPLLAGAGVVGLAVGFGAQKLVSDVFSGFFYLLDDAFRVGEYLTTGSVSGTVESITLRNVMLRHHRGMLQIVPHSELGAITNYMRGGMVVKFNLDFPYDSDIDKIRKIIKKVGIAMLDDEELGKDFLQPVKSQGVREITNSVMTIRVKFTAQPGKQFVIRREAFKRITEALKAKNIHYAHRKVIVDVPGLGTESPKELSQEQKETIANAVGAAAGATIQQEQEALEKAQKTS